LAVGFRTGNLGVQGRGVGSRSDDERGAGIEDGGAPGEAEVFAVDRRSKGNLPEPVGVDVGDRRERRRVDLGLVDPAKRDLSVVLPVGEARDLVRGDGRLDEPGLGERLGRSVDFLVRERGLGETDEPIKGRVVGRKLDRLDGRSAKVCAGSLSPAMTTSSVMMSPATWPVPYVTWNVLASDLNEVEDWVPRNVWFPHPPPAWDWHASPPTHMSADPESMSRRKSRGGVPSWRVAR